VDDEVHSISMQPTDDGSTYPPGTTGHQGSGLVFSRVVVYHQDSIIVGF
jgi:hypothetical protein